MNQPEETPSEARLLVSRARRLRQLAEKTWQNYNRACHKNNTERARMLLLDYKALDEGATHLLDKGLSLAKTNGEVIV